MKTQEAEQSEIATKAAVSQLALVECREAMQQVLVALGADTDTTFLTEISGREFSERARKAINGMRESHEKDTKDTKAAHQSAIDEFSDRVTQLEQQLQQERHNHEHAMEALSAQLTAEIRVSQESLRQAQDIAEQMNSELAVSTANTRAADERCAALGDVKKALVKECKAQRRRLEELEAEAASRAAEKESLMIAVQSLTRQKEALLQRVASYDAQLSSNPSTFISTSTETNANASGNVDLLGLSPTPSNQALTDDSSSADLSEALQIIARARAAGASTEASSASGLSSRLSSRKEKDEDGEKLSADAEGRASSLDLPASPSSTDEGWLTTASRPQKSDSTRTSATFGRDFLGRAMEVFSSAGSATPPAPSTAQAPLTTEGEQLVPKASPRSSMDILHSLLTYEPSKGVNKPMLTSPLVGAEDEVQATREVTPPGAATGNNLSGKSTEFSSTDVNANSLNSPSNVLRCFRCNGTLEGPKHSTCRCKEPQLEKETGFASVFSSFSWGRKG